MDNKTKKLKKRFKFIRDALADDPTLVEAVGKELLRNSLKYGPGAVEKIWKKVARYVKEEAYSSVDSIINRSVR